VRVTVDGTEPPTRRETPSRMRKLKGAVTVTTAASVLAGVAEQAVVTVAVAAYGLAADVTLGWTLLERPSAAIRAPSRAAEVMLA